MNASIILAHPRPGSLNHALAAAAAEALSQAGVVVRFHDLYAEGFDPRLAPEELESTVFVDDLARRHAAEILEAERIVVIHPSWFFQVPAVLKGWIDRVLREGVAFERAEDGVHGRLRAELALVVTTANAPRSYEENVLGDPLTTFWRDCVWLPAGVGLVERRVLGPVRGSSPAQRGAWLDEVRRRATAGLAAG